LSVCSGIEAFLKAIENLKIEHEVINYCEIDKYTSKACSLIHNIPESKNLNDITKIHVKELPSYNLLVGGTPCQNISKVGDMKGLRGNDSQLFYNYADILNYTLPEYFVFENVDNLKTVNSGEDWKIVQYELSKNYNIFSDILDAKDYEIPQSRKRLFIIGIRKDIRQDFIFPDKQKLKLRFSDMLEIDYDNKYILSDREKLYMDRTTKDGRNHWDFLHYHDTDNIYSHCVVANTYKGVPYNVLIDRRFDKTVYRKLTPLEALSLMSFDKKDYSILKENRLSDTRIYKMAGNSIVVNILQHIFKSLFNIPIEV
jgi:DNA (cytosine-5)-methyltransferase 1